LAMSSTRAFGNGQDTSFWPKVLPIAVTVAH
jgi:hypothetical protein